MNFIPLSTHLKESINPKQAWHYRIIPQEIQEDRSSFFIDEQQFSQGIKNELQIILGKELNLIPKDPETIQNTLIKYYPKIEDQSTAASRSKIGEDDFLIHLFLEAKSLDSSDIHIEIYKNDCRIRMRKDGMLIERHKVKPSEYPALVNRIKIKANLDISEKRLPQDGRIYINEAGQSFDVRVSVLPTFFGEKVVMRLLQTDSAHVQLNQIGMTNNQHQEYWKAVQKQNGIVLISGPTGSGKTTTLYSTLKELNDSKKNILTIEDPIEYTLQGVNQVQVKESIGFNFAKAMRSFLRQDPDIIMLGEIRDNETAQMAIRAALTGHLVLSTIHTNSAWGTISRLIDMDVPAFLIANTLNVSVAQRLVRTLCSHCKTIKPNIEWSSQLEDLGLDIDEFGHSVGCPQCYFTGYTGRQAIFEVLPIRSDLVEDIHNNEYNIEHYRKQHGIETLTDQLKTLLKSQQTSFEEAYPILLSI